ncbi:MAG TPA: PEP-CTERM sorting domain-containing protein [Bryobacteraceae bacterium]|nr:PEP-CTERM sorting domain-containing protein [Bryobacteraceae bacterium]
MLRNKVRLVLMAAAVCAIGNATPVVFSGSSGELSASVSFDIIGGNLVANLSNTSDSDVLVPADVLTGVFFDITGDPLLTRVSAQVADGSSVLFGTTDPTWGVGGEWAYSNALVGAPGGATQGISSSGLNLFGPAQLFAAANLQGPESPDGLQYGITSAGDNPATGNTPVTGANALTKSAVDFVLGGLPSNFSLASISNVSFQYGTALSEPSFPGTPGGEVPEPSTVVLFATGIGLILAKRVHSGSRKRKTANQI